MLVVAQKKKFSAQNLGLRMAFTYAFRPGLRLYSRLGGHNLPGNSWDGRNQRIVHVWFT